MLKYLLPPTVTKSVLLCFTLLMLVSCTTNDRRTLAELAVKNGSDAIDIYARKKAKQYQDNPDVLISDINNLKALLIALKKKASEKWGDKQADTPSNDKYVKYTEDYRSKAIVDFKAGRVTVETIGATKPKTSLRKAIVATLLSTDDPSSTDIFSAQSPQYTGKPFLYGQVVDQSGQPIRYEWRAGQFADYLIANQMSEFNTQKGKKYAVTFPLVHNHYALRKEQYSEYVLASAARYQVSPSLIYAIIETESSFNPFAVSSANAYGLMQIIPATAGKDVYTRIKKRGGQPTQADLFRPQYNIDIGVAYLHILDDIYLKKIKDAQSREYTTISAYNGGAGNVFKTFSTNRSQAPNVINRLPPQQVYQKLVSVHPKAESRRYLEKVLEFRKKYL